MKSFKKYLFIFFFTVLFWGQNIYARGVLNSSPVGRTIHVTFFKTDGKVVNASARIYIGYGSSDLCVPVKLIEAGRWSISDGFMLALDGGSLADQEGTQYTCAQETYISRQSITRPVTIKYSLENNGSVYTAANPNKQEVDLSQFVAN